MRPIITLFTDFGTADGYVGEMKGVLLSMAPEAEVVDISHDVGAQDVERARLAVARYWRKFPPHAVHIVVIDPGVGTTRRAIAVRSDGRLLVGPDNGVLSPALLVAGASVAALNVPAHAAPTFHGRDVFAPAGALLATGASLESLGPSVDDPIIRRTPEATRLPDGTLAGQVIATDHFGTLVTNLIAPRGGTIEIDGRSLGTLRRTYGDVPSGTVLALVGSSGLVEIAVRDGSAARELAASRGTPVLLRPARR